MPWLNMFSLQCHYDDLRGIAITPKATDFDVLTAGVDGIICGFDTSTCKAVSKVQLKVTALIIHLNGQNFIKLCISIDITKIKVWMLT